MNNITADGDIVVIDGELYVRRSLDGYTTTVLPYGMEARDQNGSSGPLYFNHGGGDVYVGYNGTTYMNDVSGNVIEGNNITAANDIRAPIFYDTGNPAYYGNFAETSMMNNITVDGDIVANNNVYPPLSERYDSGYVNNFDQSVNFECPDGFYMTGTYSYHSNFNEDRRFGFYCRRL